MSKFRAAILHPTANAVAVINSLGFVPEWLMAADDSESFIDIVNREYISRWNSHTQGRLDLDTGHYSYPGDPVMQPHAKIDRADAHETIYIYNYSFWAVVFNEGHPKAGTWDMARLD